MNRKSLALFLLLSITVSAFSQKFEFSESTPEAQGIPSESILKMITGWEKEIQTVHSFILLRHGKKVAEGWWDPYQKSDPHILFSLSKSFTSAAVGFAVQEKQLSIYDKVVSFFPDLVPSDASDNLKAMRIKDLLAMATGHRFDTGQPMRESEDKENPVKVFFSLPVEHKPGTLFIYNSGATDMLSAIVQKVTGQKLIDYLQPRLFDPLEIKRPKWEETKRGVNYGRSGLFLPTNDIAKFGQLYLQKGMWNGKQILSPEWIELSSSKQSSNGSNPDSQWDQGYGFQFWKNRIYGYRGDGARGQFCLIFPEFDMVLAITSGTPDMAGVMDVVWKQLLPALTENKLEENPGAAAKLKTKLSNMTVPYIAGKSYSTSAKKLSGKTFQLEENSLGIKTVAFSFNKKGNSVLFVANDGEGSVASGYQQWIPSLSGLNGNFQDDKKLIASNSAWTSDSTFVLDISYKETELILHLVFSFENDGVTMDGERNVSFEERKLPIVKGVIVKKAKSMAVN